MSIKSVAFSNIGWTAIDKWGNQLFSLFVFIILARLHEPAALGLIGMALVFISFVNIFLEQGFAEALIQRTELEAEHIDTIFWVNIGLGIFLSLCGILLSPVVAALPDVHAADN